MRLLMIGIAMMAFVSAAEAQTVGGEKGGKHQRNAQKTEDQTKKKVDEKAYDDALKSIPSSSEKSDPWKAMR